MINWSDPCDFIPWLFIILLCSAVGLIVLYILIRFLVCVISKVLEDLTCYTVWGIDGEDFDDMAKKALYFIATLPLRPIAWLICKISDARDEAKESIQSKHKARVKKYYDELKLKEE